MPARTGGNRSRLPRSADVRSSTARPTSRALVSLVDVRAQKLDPRAECWKCNCCPRHWVPPPDSHALKRSPGTRRSANPSHSGHDALTSVIIGGGTVGSRFLRAIRPSCEARVQFFNDILSVRKTWLAPLIIAIVIFAALFLFTGGSIDIPFLYRSTQ